MTATITRPVLSAEGHARARQFVASEGNALQKALLRVHLDGADPEHVCTALQAYGNPDGGFGHGLEADLRTPHSSVLATTVALQHLVAAGVTETHPLVHTALDYLASQFDGRHWPLIGPDCNDRPHAPWWTWQAPDPDRRSFEPNPGAEIVSYFLRFPAAASADAAAHLEQAIAHLETAGTDIDMHELLCYQRLYTTPQVPAELRARMLAPLLEATFRLVGVDPAAWEEYALTPLAVVDSRVDCLASFLGDSLDDSIRFELARQRADGSWAPTWSWGGAFPSTWAVVEVEIRVSLTVAMLAKLQRLGALAD